MVEPLAIRERSEERRSTFLNEPRPSLQQHEVLIFLDESGFNTFMTRGARLIPLVFCAWFPGEMRQRWDERANAPRHRRKEQTRRTVCGVTCPSVSGRISACALHIQRGVSDERLL